MSDGRPTPQDYASVFENLPTGQAILEDLTRRFARPAVVQGGIDAVLQTYHRDGARSVVEFIVSQINRSAGIETHNSNEE